MKKYKEIYLVVSSEGSYDDYFEHVERAFVDERRAVKYGKEIDERHKMGRVISEEIWDKAEEMVDEYTDNHKDYFIDYMDENGKYAMGERYNELYNENNRRWRALMLEMLNKVDESKTWTMEELQLQEEYEDNRYRDFHDCRVDKVILDETIEN